MLLAKCPDVCAAVQVNEYDCLLLEFVFGNRPDDAQKVRAYILETIASDPGLQQTELVFLGLFGRSCRILESKDQQVWLPTQLCVTSPSRGASSSHGTSLLWFFRSVIIIQSEVSLFL